MNPLWTLLFVLSAPRGVLSQVQLRESGPSLVKASQTLSLTCTVSGFSLSGNTIDWVPPRSRKGTGVARYHFQCGSTGYSPALESRLRITKDNSRNQVSLSLSGVTTEDTATYYCVRDLLCDEWTCDATADGRSALGQGLLVTVSSASTTAPK
nr:immunoglobulin gamma heavy chain [Bos taurus]